MWSLIVYRASIDSFGIFAANMPCCARLYRYELQLEGTQHMPSICHAITVLQAGSNGSEPCQLAVACHASLQVHIAMRQMCWGVQLCCIDVVQLSYAYSDMQMHLLVLAGLCAAGQHQQQH